MLHNIAPEKHGPHGDAMAHAVSTCVHCGFCLAACPTYQELGREVDSPRGRIVLMKEVLEGTLTIEDAAEHLDACLSCLACEPACPSGVPYRDLISPFRAMTTPMRTIGFWQNVRRKMAQLTLPYPARLRAAAVSGKIGKTLPWLVPAPLRVMVDVLTRNGIEVVVPKSQACCGALSWHIGNLPAAQTFARANLKAFPDDVDAIVTNAAGCGSGMHEYPMILRGTDDQAAAETLAARVCDVSVFLARLDQLQPITNADRPMKVTYHDACHLANAQRVRTEPRELLRRVPGIELVEIDDGHLCCGSAGTYNIDQPDIAASLGRQKAENMIATGASVVASGNIGCLNQLSMHLRQLGSPIRVRHTMQVLADAYGRDARG